MSEKLIKVASLQITIDDNQTKEERIDYALNMLEKARGADLVLLPESWNVGFFSFDQYDSLSEPLDGPTVSAMQKKAADLGCILFAGSFIEKDGGRLFNTSVLIGDDGKIIGTYRKIHLFGFGSKEKEILSPGEDIKTYKTRVGHLGLSTCYDLRFPELYRKMMEKGAEIFLVTSAWPFPRLNSWIVLNQARAIENVCYLISCNCSGVTRGSRFLGHSMVVDPWGTILASSAEEERIIKTEIDLDAVKKIRSVFPPLQDRVIKN